MIHECEKIGHVRYYPQLGSVSPDSLVTTRCTGERKVTSFILIFRYNKRVYLKHITQKAILSVLLQDQDLLHLIKC